MRKGFDFLFHIDRVWSKSCRILAATNLTLVFLNGCAGSSMAPTYVTGTRVVASKVCIELNPMVYDRTLSVIFANCFAGRGRIVRDLQPRRNSRDLPNASGL